MFDKKNKNFFENHIISHYECDTTRCLSPVYMLRISEEISDRHLKNYNLGYDLLLNQDAVFLLSAIQVNCFEKMRMGEEITVRTAQRFIKGIRFVRDVTFEKENKICAQVTQNWFLANCKTHSPIMPSDIKETAQVPEDVIGRVEDAIIRIPKIKTDVYDYSHIVKYSDLDFNGHMNNTRYAEMVYSSLGDLPLKRETDKLSLSFCSEAKLGDTVNIKVMKNDEQTFVIGGDHPRGHCFDCEIIFK